MKMKIVMLLFTIVVGLTAWAQKPEKQMRVVSCKVSMDCMACKNKIEKNIAFENGVKGLDVDLATKTVSIKYRTDKTSAEKLKKAIEGLGYSVEVVEEKLVK